MTMKQVPAAQFKAQCLALMEQVAQTGSPLVVTKHGKPMVQIGPVEPAEDEIFGFLKGKVKIVGDIMNTIPLSDWNLPE
jgi:prevent-host-death family protein